MISENSAYFTVETEKETLNKTLLDIGIGQADISRNSKTHSINSNECNP